jgi:hypothetical protein
MAWCLVKHRDNFQGSLPCSQELATGPYPDPVQSSPQSHIPFI